MTSGQWCWNTFLTHWRETDEQIVKLSLIISTPGSYLLALAEAICVWSKRWMEDGRESQHRYNWLLKFIHLSLIWQIISVLSAWLLLVVLLINIPLSCHSLPQGSSLTIQVHAHSFQPCRFLATLIRNSPYSLGSQNNPSVNGSRNL